MPHLPESVRKLSLRHLPDLSDASFSFQIPVSDKNDYLLADGDADFFRGADDSIATPAPARTARDPLTLSQLTPRPQFENAAPCRQVPHSPSGVLQDRPHPSNRSQKHHNAQGGEKPNSSRTLPKTTSTPKLNITTQALQVPSREGSPAAGRLETLRAEVEMLTSVPPARTITPQEPKSSASSSVPKGIRRQSHEKRRLAAKRHGTGIAKPKRKSTSTSSAACSLSQTVVEGGITKVCNAGRNRPQSSNVPNFQDVASIPAKAPPTELVHLHPLVAERTMEMDPNISLSSVTGGVAARLVQYSEKLIGSFGLFNSDRLSGPIDGPETGPSYFGKTTSEELSESGLQARNDERDTPLTLSQLSPHKLPPRAGSSTSPIPLPVVPRRSSTKRPAPIVSDSNHVHKKGRTTSSKDETVSQKQTAPGASETRSSQSKRQRAVIDARLASNMVSHRKASARGTKGGRRAPLRGSGDSQHQDASIHTASTSSSMSSSLQVSRMQSMNVDSAYSVSQEQRSGTSNPIASLSRSAKPVAIAPAIPTRPVAFNFHLDRRMESRKGGETDKGKASLKQKKSATSLSIPDFKALHAAQDAELAARKENIHLVIPHPIEFKTDQRVKERHKFDERMKEKERELERAMEKRRREREEAEEEEIREMRKRAVPKAHEVPEWYKEAPKRKDKVVDPIDR